MRPIALQELGLLEASAQDAHGHTAPKLYPNFLFSIFSRMSFSFSHVAQSGLGLVLHPRIGLELLIPLSPPLTEVLGFQASQVYAELGVGPSRFLIS